MSVRTINGLAVGEHELRIVVLGEARPAARGTQTSIDAFTVIPCTGDVSWGNRPATLSGD